MATAKEFIDIAQALAKTIETLRVVMSNGKSITLDRSEVEKLVEHGTYVSLENLRAQTRFFNAGQVVAVFDDENAPW